jgi:hypothetical protein
MIPINIITMYFEKTTNGIEYTEALVSSEGAGFTL